MYLPVLLGLEQLVGGCVEQVMETANRRALLGLGKLVEPLSEELVDLLLFLLGLKLGLLGGSLHVGHFRLVKLGLEPL